MYISISSTSSPSSIYAYPTNGTTPIPLTASTYLNLSQLSSYTHTHTHTSWPLTPSSSPVLRHPIKPSSTHTYTHTQQTFSQWTLQAPPLSLSLSLSLSRSLSLSLALSLSLYVYKYRPGTANIQSIDLLSICTFIYTRYSEYSVYISIYLYIYIY
jgi:hypothetical protein